MQPAQTFLETILPETGVYCAIHFVLDARAPQGKRAVHEWASTLAEAAERVVYWASQGLDTYHACATYKEPGTSAKGRRQDNVAWVAAFWLDLDCGEGKAYPGPREALEAVGAFCRATGLPQPTLVLSGHGVHAYWPIEEPLAPEAWTPLAMQLKELTKLHGLGADHRRTSDCASILRTPGTTNYKSEPRPVRCLHNSGIYTNDAVIPKLAVAKPQAPEGLNIDIGQTFSGQLPAYAEAIAEVCPQIAIIRATKGNVSEPTWYAGLTILARCEDGDRLAQEWSAGHPGYDFEKTEAKLAHAKAAPGPATCGTFSDGNEAPCNSCPNKGLLKSPITLGVAQGLDSVMTNPTDKLPALPPPYYWGPGNSVWYTQRDPATGTTSSKLLYKYPLYLEALRNGETQVNTQSVLKHYVPGKGWLTCVISMKDLRGQGAAGILAGNDIAFGPDSMKRALDFLHRSFEQAKDQEKREMGFEQMGWKDDGSFVIAYRQYMPDGSVRVVGGDKAYETRAGFFQEPRGSLDAWRRAAQPMFGAGLEPHSFIVLAHFAAPLMKMTGDVGTIISAWGPRGAGKSHAATVGMSIYGADKGMEIVNNDTAVGRTTSLGVLSNLPVVINDIHRMNPETVEGFAIKFTEGRDRIRGNSDGSLNAPARSWQTIMTVTGNHSLIERLGTPEDACRIFEFFMPALGPQYKQHEGQQMLRETIANRGIAGDWWIRMLVNPKMREVVQRMINDMMTSYSQLLGGDPADRFWIRLLACVATAAAIVSKTGVLEFSPKRIMDWAVAQMSDLRTASNAHTEEAAASLARYIDAHQHHTLVTIGTPGQNRRYIVKSEPRGPMMIRIELDNAGDPSRVYLEQKAFRAWCIKEGLNFLNIRDALTYEKVLERHTYLFVLGKGTHLSSGQVKVWDINPRIPAMSGALEVVDGGISPPQADVG